MVRRVAGRGETFEPDHTVADHLDILGRNRRELAPEDVEGIAVEPSGARLEPRRVDDVRRADLGDVHSQPRVLADQRAGGAGVVEVDVREQQVADVGELEPAVGERLLQRREAGGRPAVVQGEPVRGLEQVAAHDAFGLVVEVDEVGGGHVLILAKGPLRPDSSYVSSSDRLKPVTAVVTTRLVRGRG